MLPAPGCLIELALQAPPAESAAPAPLPADSASSAGVAEHAVVATEVVAARARASFRNRERSTIMARFPLSGVGGRKPLSRRMCQWVLLTISMRYRRRCATVWGNGIP